MDHRYRVRYSIPRNTISKFYNPISKFKNFDIGMLRYWTPISKFMIFDIGKLRYRDPIWPPDIEGTHSISKVCTTISKVTRYRVPDIGSRASISGIRTSISGWQGSRCYPVLGGGWGWAIFIEGCIASGIMSTNICNVCKYNLNTKTELSNTSWLQFQYILRPEKHA